MKTDLESRVKKIEDRNRRVEEDKRWETSLFRRVSISLLTYLVILTFLIIIDNEHPYINAIVPTLGYFLSTLVMNSAKTWWLKNK